jgi:hypothetical protein
MATTTMSEMEIIVPIELVTVDDSTNLSYSDPDEPEEVPEPEPEETPEPEEEEPPEPPAEELEPDEEPDPLADDDVGEEEPEPVEEEVVPEEVEPEPEEAPEPELTPTPEPKVVPPEEDPREQTNSFLNRINKDLANKKRERKTEQAKKPDFKEIENANKNLRSAGDRKRDTATWTALLKSKIETKCFRDPSDMANADRLSVTYKITFRKDGNLQRAPRRVKPSIIPMGDQQLRVYDINAQRAIEKCAPYNDIFPAELYEEWKDFTFVFGRN